MENDGDFPQFIVIFFIYSGPAYVAIERAEKLIFGFAPFVYMRPVPTVNLQTFETKLQSEKVLKMFLSRARKHYSFRWRCLL